MAQGIGSALYEELRLDGQGRVLTATLRNYHIPQLADVPYTEVYFAPTVDELGSLRCEVDERVALQSGGARTGQRDPRRDRGTPPRATDGWLFVPIDHRQLLIPPHRSMTLRHPQIRPEIEIHNRTPRSVNANAN